MRDRCKIIKNKGLVNYYLQMDLCMKGIFNYHKVFYDINIFLDTFRMISHQVMPVLLKYRVQCMRARVIILTLKDMDRILQLTGTITLVNGKMIKNKA